MEEVKATGEYTIYKKKSGRFAIKGNDGKWINGKKKSEILFGEKLISVAPPKVEAPVVEAPVAEAEAPQEEAAPVEEEAAEAS